MWKKHEKIETNVVLMAALTLVTVSMGGLGEIVPLFTIVSTFGVGAGVAP
jgi:cytochrome c oxidase cbb3-type subunit 2